MADRAFIEFKDDLIMSFSKIISGINNKLQKKADVVSF